MQTSDSYVRELASVEEEMLVLFDAYQRRGWPMRWWVRLQIERLARRREVLLLVLIPIEQSTR